MQPTESAALVLVPEAESVVADYRADLDAAAGLGVPAHVTVLYPFVPPERVDDAVISALQGAVRSVAAFDVTFARLGWFDRSVLWLAPEPAEPFLALTAAVRRAFPGHEPYGGEIADVVPHLTIGLDQADSVLESASRAIQPSLPVTARISAAVLMQGSLEPGSWRVVADLPLSCRRSASGRERYSCFGTPSPLPSACKKP
jgi:2'-5' RNA ligase